MNAGPHGGFSTKAFTHRMLEAVKHPLLSIKGHNLDDLLAMQKWIAPMDRCTMPSSILIQWEVARGRGGFAVKPRLIVW